MRPLALWMTNLPSWRLALSRARRTTSCLLSLRASGLAEPDLVALHPPRGSLVTW